MLARWTMETTGTRDVRVLDAEHPSTGWSSETVLVDLAWPDDGGETRRELVVRLAPPMVGTFRVTDLSQQMIVQTAAVRPGSRSCHRELVTDPQWLGVPFIVMPRVRGNIIGEVTAFDPWLLSLSSQNARRYTRRSSEQWWPRIGATSRGAGPAFPNATTKPSSISGPTISTGRAARGRSPGSSPLTGAGPTARRGNPVWSALG